MADGFISGQVTDGSDPVEGAVVEAIDQNENSVIRTTTDSNGDYEFSRSDLLTGERTYHVVARDEVSGTYYRAQGKPYITAQGQLDELVAWFDAQALSGYSDGDSVSTWNDELGDYDATGGSAVYRTSGQNGHASLEFSTDDVYKVDGFSQSPPFVNIIVAEIFDDTQQRRILDRNTGNMIQYWNDGANWRIIGDGHEVDGSTDSTKQLITGIFDGTSSVIREDGTEIATGDTGDSAYEDFAIGGRYTGSDYWDGYISEVRLYDGRPTDSEIQAVEDELIDKWSITT